MIILSFIIYKYSDDCPYGNFTEIKHAYNNSSNNNLDISNYSNYSNDNEINLENIVNDIEINIQDKCISIKNIKIFTLALVYLFSFGFEMTLYTNIFILTEYEDKSTEDKIYIMFLFSILNLICRPLGGYISDIQYKYFKIIGKIKIMILFQIATLITNNMSKYHLLLLSGFNNLLQGSIIGIIPHINSKNLGINFGIISGFGILGGIIGNILFYYFDNRNVFKYINTYNITVLILNIFCLL
jgi:NNP family nitrate/nitrite transporter-like MFS transporter